MQVSDSRADENVRYHPGVDSKAEVVFVFVCVGWGIGKRPSSRFTRRLVTPVLLVEIVNSDVVLREVSNRVDNDAVRPNNKDRSMGWFGTKPVMKLTNRHWKIVVFAGQRTTLRIVL